MRLSLRAPLRPRPSRRAKRPTLSSSQSRGLERALRSALRGEVRFDDGSRALYSTDASNFRQVPIGVVIPRTMAEVVQTIALCREFNAPVLCRGGGTSLAGQSCNVAVVLDFSKYLHRVLAIDPERRLARVQPGVVLDHLRQQAEQHGLTFGPDPATHDRCTLGGMLGNNSCGVHSQMAGRTSDNVHSMEVLTYDGQRLTVGPTPEDELARLCAESSIRGQRYRSLKALVDQYGPLIRERFPPIPRRVSGYNLDELLPERGFQLARALVGSEGTCVTILEATLQLVESPPHRVLVVLGYPDIYHAADQVMEITAHHPIGLEGMDHALVEGMRRKGLEVEQLSLLPEGHGWLLVEFGGSSRDEARARAEKLQSALARTKHPPTSVVYERPDQAHRVWSIRESGLGATARIPGAKDTWPGWEDAAVPPARLSAYLRDYRQLLDHFGLDSAMYGHFGQGCVHCRIDFDLVTPRGVRRYRQFVERAAELVVRHGGSLSGEHGDGQARAEFLEKMYGRELVKAMREFKAVWDPHNRMNPHKVVEPYRVDQNLRLGPHYAPPPVHTEFSFGEDRGSFARATTRCVGVGLCRRTEHGVMCPSYMVTREEAHSTRGRARLLFELLQGQPLDQGLHSEAVRESLDLCLACKGCKSECPVNVDMATYKAEFLFHYYRRKLRPRSAYAFGYIMHWARLGAHFPRLANILTHAPGLSRMAQWAADVAPQRTVPALALRPFQQLSAHRARVLPADAEVVLFPDTFNNYFHPQVGLAAEQVLREVGMKPWVPASPVCCGRPLYDYGLLRSARRRLLALKELLGPAIERGLPMVVLEPSCAATFRDELPALFPHDFWAKRLSEQTFTLGEFLHRRVNPARLPRLRGQALVQPHCHDRSVLNFSSQQQLLQSMGLEVEVPDSGCCGMAGAFGFERAHFPVSVACGERVLLPKVRKAPRETLILADGFSCREQVKQGTARRPLHLAEAWVLARQRGPATPPGELPEMRYQPPEIPRRLPRWPLWSFAAGALAVWSWRRRRTGVIGRRLRA